MRTLSLIVVGGFIAALATSATLLSCDQVNGTGEVIKKNLTVEPFHGIEVHGSMDVVVTRSDERSVVVEAQSNIAELVTTFVKNGVWIIRTSENYSTDKPFVVHISTPEMDRVAVSGSGDVKGVGTFNVKEASVAIAGSGDVSMSYQAGSISAAIDGSGDVRLSGTSDRLQVSIAGSGDVKAGELAVKDMGVAIAGSGDVSANASGNVDVDIAGSGDVVLASKPANVNERIAGSGSVRVAE